MWTVRLLERIWPNQFSSVGIFFSALANSSKLSNTCSGGELTTPTPTPETHSTSKHCWWVQTNHMWQVGKSPVIGKGETGTGQRFPSRAHGAGSWGLLPAAPFYPQQPVPQMDFCPLSPHQTSHSAPASHPISPGGRTKGRGRGQRGSGFDHSGNSTARATFSHHCLWSWGPHRGAQSGWSCPGVPPSLWSPALALAHHGKATAGCRTAHAAVSASVSASGTDWTCGSTRTAKGMQSSGRAPQYGAQGEQPHSARAPSPLLGPLRALPSTTGPLVLSKPFLTQPTGGLPNSLEAAGNPMC